MMFSDSKTEVVLLCCINSSHQNFTYLQGEKANALECGCRLKIEGSLLHRLGYEISLWLELEAKAQPHFF